MAQQYFLNNQQWMMVDGEGCRVIKFVYFDNTQEIEVDGVKYYPYAILTLECPKLLQPVNGLIFHKQDYEHLRMAFENLKQDEEVIISWSNKHYKSWAKIFSAFMPKLWVMVCREGAFKLLTDNNYRAELTGEARWLASRPIVDWKPDVME